MNALDPSCLRAAPAPATRARNSHFSPYRVFTREEWAKLRADTPMTLVPRDLEQLSGLIEDLSMAEVEQIYLPMSRLLNLHVAGAQELHAVTSRFLGRRDGRVPYILGIAGSVAVGKSTTARVLRALLARWPDHPRVDLITTDGFLYPNAELERRGLMNRKGFPESFDTARLLNFLHDVKSGREQRRGARLLALPLRHHSRPDHGRRPARHPDRRGPQRAAAGAHAQGRRGHSRSSPTSSTSRSTSMPTPR